MILWFGFIPSLAVWMAALSPKAPDLRGAARLAAETPRQIANAHTVFNIGNTLVLIGFAGPLARLATRWIPENAGERIYYPDNLIGIGRTLLAGPCDFGWIRLSWITAAKINSLTIPCIYMRVTLDAGSRSVSV